MAFVDTTIHGHVLARAYRITVEQFADLHAQENGGDADAADLAAFGDGQRVIAGRGNYPVIIRCGTLDGVPMFTFTAERLPSCNVPSAAYVRTMAAGLAESHHMTTTPIVDYLRAAPAVGASYDPATLSTVVAAGVEDAMVAPPTHSGPS